MSQRTHESITNRVLEIIAETAEIDLDDLRSEMLDKSLPFPDVGIDSLDFLDIKFSLEKEFGLKNKNLAIPLDYEEWTRRMGTFSETHDAYGHPYYTLGSIVAHIEDALGLPIVKGTGEPFQRLKIVRTPRPRKKPEQSESAGEKPKKTYRKSPPEVWRGGKRVLKPPK